MASEPCTRPYDDGDRDAVIALWQETFPDDTPWNKPADVIDRKTAFQPEGFLVAVRQGSVVGTIVAGYDGFRGWLHHVAVKPDNQGEGIARLLIEHAEQVLADLGCVKVNLQVRDSNSAVAVVYKSLGYTEEQRLSFGKRLV